jgi:RecB family exonuclease
MECLATEAKSRGIHLIPPRATTVGQIVDVLFPPERPRASPEAQIRSWALALLEAGVSVLEPAFPHLTPETLRARREGIAAVLADVKAELAQEGHDFQDVTRLVGSWDGFQDKDRWQALSLVERRALEILEKAGLEDPWEARRRVASAPPAVPPATGLEVWLVGLAELPGMTRRLLSASGALLRVLVHGPAPSTATAAAYDDWGIPVPSFWAQHSIPLRDHQVHVADRPADQAATVVRILQGMHPAPHTDEVILAVRQGSEVLPHLAHQLGREGVRTRAGGGTPIENTAPYRLVGAVAAFLETRRWESLASLLRHPAAPALLEAAGLGEGLNEGPEWADFWFNHYLPHTMGGSLPSVEEGTDRRTARERVSFARLIRTLQAEGPIASFQGPAAPISHWMPHVMTLLLKAYGGGTLQEHQPADRLILLTLDLFREGAEALRALPGTLDERVSGAEALNVLLTTVRSSAIPLEADPQAVELLDWLEVAVDDVPVVLVTGFNEGIIPSSQVGDPLLPDRLRSQLQLPDNTRRRGRDAYRLTALLHTCPTVHVITGRRSAAGDPLRPSRLLFQTDAETAARRVRATMAPQGTHAPPRWGSGPVRPAQQSAFQVPPEPEIQVAPALLPNALAVTAFRSLLADPYRFALETLYGLDSIEDAAREMDGLIFGSLAHDVLEAFGREALKDPAWPVLKDPQRLGDHLAAVLRQRARRQFGTHPLPAVALQCLHLEGRLRAFARAQVQWSEAGWEIRSVEDRLEGGKYPFPVDQTPFFLRGRIDRVDYHPKTGTWAVLDYKTSAEATPPERAHRKGKKEWVDLQLPLYRHLVLGLRDAEGHPIIPQDALERGSVRVGYVVLPQSPHDTAFLLADWGEEELQGADERAREAIRVLRTGHFIFDPERSRRSGFAGDPFQSFLSAGLYGAAPDADVAEEVSPS